MTIQHAMVLAAGNGTRLHPLTLSVPKPLLPLSGKPIIEYNLDLLKKHHISHAHINACYLASVMMDYFDNREKDSLCIDLNIEEKMLGSAGGLKAMEGHFPPETLLVISGDLLTNTNLEDMYHFHKSRGSMATMGLTTVEDPREFGIVVTDNTGKIVQFQEKPETLEEAFSNTINVGIYIFEPEIFSYIPPNHFFDFSKDLFPVLLEEGIPFYGYPINAYWRDLGTISQLTSSQKDIEEHLFVL